jgi:hypothetical protein
MGRKAKAPFINAGNLPYVKVFGDLPVAPFTQVHMFVKNNQSMTKQDFVQSFQEIRDYMTDQGVNFGLLMFVDGTYVFTEKKLKLNDMVVKLTTGINYNGVVKNAKAELASLNSHLGR